MTKNGLRSWAALGLIVVLQACAPEYSYSNITSGSSLPPEGRTQTKLEACIQSCNNAHVRCLDVSSTRRDTKTDVVNSIYGAQTDCDYELRGCLPKCNGR